MSETLVLVFVVRYHENHVAVRVGTDVCFLVKVDDPSVDGIFDDWPAHRVPSGVATIYSMGYRSIDLAVRVVHLLAADFRLMVDTNYERVLPGVDLTPAILAGGHPGRVS